MNSNELFWWRLLVLVTANLIAFGLSLVLLPDIAQQGFSLMVYFSAQHVDTFGADAVAYIRLVTAVLGCVMVGWGVVLMYLAWGPLKRGSRDAWWIFVLSLTCWFIPDTTYSLISGFWQNAVLNMAFAFAFALPLLGLKKFARSSGVNSDTRS
jgi:hypothetical protein